MISASTPHLRSRLWRSDLHTQGVDGWAASRRARGHAHVDALVRRGSRPEPGSPGPGLTSPLFLTPSRRWSRHALRGTAEPSGPVGRQDGQGTRVLIKLREFGFGGRLTYKTDDDTRRHYHRGIYVSQAGTTTFDDRRQEWHVRAE